MDMRTFLIVDREVNKNYRLNYSDKKIFESDYVLRPEITKLMLGNLDRGE